MLLTTPNPIPAGCPWHELSQYGLPNVDWCEAYVCSTVNEPANAWSNVAFLLVAAAMAWVARSLPAGPIPSGDSPGAAAVIPPSSLRRFAPAAAMVGIGSFIYHATNTHPTQILDFFGMYVFCFLLLLLNAQRLGALTEARLPGVFWASVLGTTVLTTVLVRRGAPIQGIVGLLILGIVVTEVVLYRRRRAPYSLRWFLLSLLLLNAGAVCSVLDVTRRWCDPQNHFVQGHATWHVLSALSLLASQLHYRQFVPGVRRASGGG